VNGKHVPLSEVTRLRHVPVSGIERYIPQGAVSVHRLPNKQPPYVLSLVQAPCTSYSPSRHAPMRLHPTLARPATKPGGRPWWTGPTAWRDHTSPHGVLIERERPNKPRFWVLLLLQPVCMPLSPIGMSGLPRSSGRKPGGR